MRRVPLLHHWCGRLRGRGGGWERRLRLQLEPKSPFGQLRLEKAHVFSRWHRNVTPCLCWCSLLLAVGSDCLARHSCKQPLPRGDAALNNFFRAWSPAKKQWCCKERLKGCEGNTKPSVDPGAGMMWKHVQVNGYWTWQVVAGAGGAAAVPASLPYDCNVGQVNWKIGWSAPKKSWCCAHNHVGCPGSSGGITSHATHVTVHYTHGGTVGAAAAAGGSWHHSGSWHHNVHVVHHVHHLTHARRLEGVPTEAACFLKLARLRLRSRPSQLRFLDTGWKKAGLEVKQDVSERGDCPEERKNIGLSWLS